MVVGAFDFFVLLLFVFTLNHAPLISIIWNKGKNIQLYYFCVIFSDCANFFPNKVAFSRSCSVGTKQTLNFSSKTDSFIEDK